MQALSLHSDWLIQLNRTGQIKYASHVVGCNFFGLHVQYWHDKSWCGTDWV